MIPDIKIIDIRTCDLILSEVMARIEVMQAAHGEFFEIFMDGDDYGINARLRDHPVQGMHQFEGVTA